MSVLWILWQFAFFPLEDLCKSGIFRTFRFSTFEHHGNSHSHAITCELLSFLSACRYFLCIALSHRALQQLCELSAGLWSCGFGTVATASSSGNWLPEYLSKRFKRSNWTVKTFNQRSVVGLLQSKSVTSLPQSITELGRILQARLVMILFVWSIVFTSIYHQGFATDEDWTICWKTCKSLWSFYCHKETFFTFLFRSEDDSPKVCSTGGEHFWDGHCIHCMT